MSFENTLYQNPAHTLAFVDSPAAPAAPSPGLAQAGFLRSRSTLFEDHMGVSDDQLALNAIWAGVTPVRNTGELLPGFSITEVPSGSDLAWQLQPPTGFRIEATRTP